MNEVVEGSSIKVSVIGLGFVGLPLLLLFHQKGYEVTGIDIDVNKIRKLNQGNSYIAELSDEKIAEVNGSMRFQVTTDYDKIKEQDVVIVCVPTPLNEKQIPDLSFLKSAGEAISGRLKKEQLVVLESSTYPGTTRDFFKPILEKNGMIAGEDFYLAYSPERVDPGNHKVLVERVPKLVSGMTETCLQKINGLYRSVYKEVVKVSSLEIAELSKLLENSYRFINISFINQFAMLCDSLSIDVWEVIDAASTKPYGFQPFYPGPGVGGHCIPVDPLYLTYKAQQVGAPYDFISLAKNVNDAFPSYLVERIEEILKDYKSLNKSKVFIYGVTYKSDIDDARESPAIRVIEKLMNKGALVQYHDPYVKHLMLDEENELTCTPITSETIQDVDCVIILTNHSAIPIQMILDHAKIVYDTRNITKGYKGNGNVFRLGGG